MAENKKKVHEDDLVPNPNTEGTKKKVKPRTANRTLVEQGKEPAYEIINEDADSKKEDTKKSKPNEHQEQEHEFAEFLDETDANENFDEDGLEDKEQRDRALDYLLDKKAFEDLGNDKKTITETFNKIPTSKLVDMASQIKKDRYAELRKKKKIKDLKAKKAKKPVEDEDDADDDYGFKMPKVNSFEDMSSDILYNKRSPLREKLLGIGEGTVNLETLKKETELDHNTLAYLSKFANKYTNDIVKNTGKPIEEVLKSKEWSKVLSNKLEALHELSEMTPEEREEIGIHNLKNMTDSEIEAALKKGSRNAMLKRSTEEVRESVRKSVEKINEWLPAKISKLGDTKEGKDLHYIKNNIDEYSSLLSDPELSYKVSKLKNSGESLTNVLEDADTFKDTHKLARVNKILKHILKDQNSPEDPSAMQNLDESITKAISKLSAAKEFSSKVQKTSKAFDHLLDNAKTPEEVKKVEDMKYGLKEYESFIKSSTPELRKKVLKLDNGERLLNALDSKAIHKDPLYIHKVNRAIKEIVDEKGEDASSMDNLDARVDRILNNDSKDLEDIQTSDYSKDKEESSYGRDSFNKKTFDASYKRTNNWLEPKLKELEANKDADPKKVEFYKKVKENVDELQKLSTDEKLVNKCNKLDVSHLFEALNHDKSYDEKNPEYLSNINKSLKIIQQEEGNLDDPEVKKRVMERIALNTDQEKAEQLKEEFEGTGIPFFDDKSYDGAKSNWFSLFLGALLGVHEVSDYDFDSKDMESLYAQK